MNSCHRHLGIAVEFAWWDHNDQSIAIECVHNIDPANAMLLKHFSWAACASVILLLAATCGYLAKVDLVKIVANAPNKNLVLQTQSRLDLRRTYGFDLFL